MPNVCGEGCVATTCSDVGAQCGGIDNGCGQTIDCGSCNGTETCGGGGTANQCGEGCEPLTCTDVGAACGALDDGCGQTLACGVCQAGLSCGGGGSANQCGAPCLTDCPDGFSCDTSAGVCAGGSPQALDLNVISHAVSGVVTLNGNQPTANCGGEGGGTSAVVQFSNDELGYNFGFLVPCTTGAFRYSGTLFPGTYRVTVRGEGNGNLPDTPFVAQQALQISGDTTQDLNVVTHTISGLVTLNGNQPTANCGGEGGGTAAVVQLSDDSQGYNFGFFVQCGAGAFRYNGTLFPGNYRVTVRGEGNGNLPDTRYVALQNLQVAADITQDLNVIAHAASGLITLNGGQPTANCGGEGGGTSAVVRFSDDSQGYNFGFFVPCATGAFRYNGTLFPGNYRVTVRGEGNGNLPDTRYVAQQSLQVAADIAQDINVITHTASGVVTLNGNQPTANCAGEGGGTSAVVQFNDDNLGYNFGFFVPCTAGAFQYNGMIFPGNYRVTVRGQGNGNLPDTRYVAQQNLQVAANINQDLNVTTHTASGVITLNGNQPTVNCGGEGGGTSGVVQFTDDALGYTFGFFVPCGTGAFRYSGTVFPGNYRVTVRGEGNGNLPDTRYVAQPNLRISADISQDLDVITLSVGGEVTLNGNQPTANCRGEGSETSAVVEFTEANFGYNFDFLVPCEAGAFRYNGTVFPGNYRVTVRGEGNGNLPDERYVAIGSVRIP